MCKKKAFSSSCIMLTFSLSLFNFLPKAFCIMFIEFMISFSEECYSGNYSHFLPMLRIWYLQKSLCLFEQCIVGRYEFHICKFQCKHSQQEKLHTIMYKIVESFYLNFILTNLRLYISMCRYLVLYISYSMDGQKVHMTYINSIHFYFSE